LKITRLIGGYGREGRLKRLRLPDKEELHTASAATAALPPLALRLRPHSWLVRQQTTASRATGSLKRKKEHRLRFHEARGCPRFPYMATGEPNLAGGRPQTAFEQQRMPLVTGTKV